MSIIWKLRSQHILLLIFIVSIVSITITLRWLQCRPCIRTKSVHYRALFLDANGPYLVTEEDKKGAKHAENNEITTQNTTQNSTNYLQKNIITTQKCKSNQTEENKLEIVHSMPLKNKELNNQRGNNNVLVERALSQPIKQVTSGKSDSSMQNEPKTPIEMLCKGFQKEQTERITALKEKCEARFARNQQEEPLRNLKGPTRIYFHRNRSLMWCETPKAMSTSWGRALCALEGRDRGDENYVAVHIFLQEYLEFFSPASLTPKVFEHVPHFESYRKLLFLRDPFTRLHSAYIDKVAQPILPYHNLVESINRELKCNYSHIENKCIQDLERAKNKRDACRRLINEHGTGVIMESSGLRETITNLLGFDPDPKAFDIKVCKRILKPDCSSNTLLKGCDVDLTAIPSFAEFVQYILEARDLKYALDRHWSPVALNCAPCLMQYTRILRLESMIRDAECTLREIYPPASYEKLVTPTHYRIVNGKVDWFRAKNSNETFNLNLHHQQNSNNSKTKHFHNANSTLSVGALRPRERDYTKHEAISDSLKDHYSQLSPDLMQRLWDFYRDDTELLDYTSEPDFGIEKFKTLHKSR